MKNVLVKAAGVPAAVIAFVVVQASIAWATPDSAAVSAVGAGAGDLKDTLVAVAQTVLPFAAAVVAVLIGWRLARRFVRA